MRTSLLIIYVLLAGCADKEHASVDTAVAVVDSVPVKTVAPEVNLTVVPGRSIGNVKLGQDSQTLGFLGPADLSDSAMGKSWQTWYSASGQVSGKSELNLFTTYKDKKMDGKVVRQIRITSPDFKTESGIHTQTTFDDLQKLMPDLDYIGHFRNPGTTNNVELYDAPDLGIAFEIENDGSSKRCIALIIHTAKQSVMEEYTTFRPELERG